MIWHEFRSAKVPSESPNFLPPLRQTSKLFNPTPIKGGGLELWEYCDRDNWWFEMFLVYFFENFNSSY